ncbi:MAG: hypothetical protein JW714_01055 [Candidatus Omnitrophica bacterium]|nr:hypothetical protein [Candidatus Omnitrophota bacterium]
MRIFRNKLGQNTAEYAILLSLVIAAVLGMRTYAQRGIHGRVKDIVDAMVGETSGGTEFALHGVSDANPRGETYGQFEPYYLHSSFTVGRTENATNEFGTATSEGTAKSAEKESSEGTERSGFQTQETW